MQNILKLFVVVSAILLLVGGVSGRAQEDSQTPQQKTEQVLDKSVTFEFKELPLEEGLGQFAADFGVQFQFSPSTKTVAPAVDPKIPVTLKLKNISLRSALHLLLDPHRLEPIVQPDGTMLLVPGSKELIAKRVESAVQASAHEHLYRTMATKVSSQFYNVPLHHVIEFHATNSDCQIVVDRATLLEAKVISPEGEPYSEEIVSVDFKGFRLDDALQLILLPLDLRAVIRDEVILVVARDKDEKLKPSPEVAKALAAKLDLKFSGELQAFASHLTQQTGISFGVYRRGLKAAGITMNSKVTIDANGVTPAEALELAKLPVKLQLIERDGMVLITVNEKK
jgi:hypothetical protein